LGSWKEIPQAQEFTSQIITSQPLSADMVESKLNANNIFTIARRNVDNQELMYSSMKFVNNIWVLAEFKVTAGTNTIMVRTTTDV